MSRLTGPAQQQWFALEKPRAPIRPSDPRTARQPPRRWPARAFYLTFLSLAASFCQERPKAMPAFSMPWRPQYCLSPSGVLPSSTVGLAGVPGLTDCSELARLFLPFPAEDVNESSSADTRPTKPLVEAGSPRSNVSIGEIKTIPRAVETVDVRIHLLSRRHARFPYRH